MSDPTTKKARWFCIPETKLKYVVAVGACLVGAPAAGSSLYGNLLTYLISYYKARMDTQILWVGPLWCSSLYKIFMPLGMICAGIAEQRINMKISLILSCAAVWIGYLASYFAVSQSLGFVCTYGVTFGFGVGMIDALVFKLAVIWWEKHSGSFIGLFVMVTAIMAIVFSQLMFVVANPENYSPDSEEDGIKYFTHPDVIRRVPNIFLVLGSIAMGVQLIGLLLIPSKKPQPPPTTDSTTAVFKDDIPKITIDNSSIQVVDPTRERSRSKLSIERTASFLEIIAGDEKSNLLGSDKAASPAFKRDLNENFVVPRKSSISELVASFSTSLSNSIDRGRKEQHNADLKKKVRPDEHPKTQKLDGEGAANSTLRTDTEQQHQERGFSPSELIHMTPFWILYVMCFLYKHTRYLNQNLYKEYGELAISNDGLLVLAGSISIGASIPGKLLIGILTDKFGVKSMMIVMSAAIAISCGLTPAAATFSPNMFIVLTVVSFSTLDTMFMLFGLTTLSMFGPKYIAANAGMINSAGMIICILEPFIIPPMISSWGFPVVYVSMAFSAFMIMVLSFVLPADYIDRKHHPTD